MLLSGVVSYPPTLLSKVYLYLYIDTKIYKSVCGYAYQTIYIHTPSTPLQHDTSYDQTYLGTLFP